MIRLELSQGKHAIIDDCDGDLAEFKWSAALIGTGNDFYAIRSTYHPKKTVYLHRMILARMFPDISRFRCDHINGDTLDNRRCNLRLALPKENNRNTTKRMNASSKYKGVIWHKNRNKWQVSIRVDGKLIYLGYFTDEIEAAKAYDRAAKKYFGEFARPNFPD